MGALALSRRIFVLVLAAMAVAGAAWAQDTGGDWDKIVAAAKTEGKVVVVGPPDAEVRRNLPKAFKDRFGIDLEYTGGRGSTNAARIQNERAAGHFTTDVVIAGMATHAGVYHAEKLLVPLKPLLILPEVVDGRKWSKGSLWFSDPEGQYILRVSNQVQRSFYINTGKVKPEEFKSAKDLLDPKWRGKMAMDDPRGAGSGLTLAARFYVFHGEDFVKKLYVDQQPRFTRDRRQLTDWLLRGTYPVTFGGGDDDIAVARQQGFPVTEVDNVLDLPPTLSAGFGQIGVLDRAPHPNAAQVFVNWIASKEGLEVYARARGEVPTRVDIDASKFVPKETIPVQGRKYLDTYSWEFVTETRTKVRDHMRKLLGGKK